MKIEATDLDGVWTVTPTMLEDHRGGFGRLFCDQEFANAGLVTSWVQASTAFTQKAGTLRGLHFQRNPHWETKLVRCTRGAAFVVLADLRVDSAQHKQWTGIEISCQNRTAIYVSPGFAQGYQTLEDETELLYQMDKHYYPDSASGVAFNDPVFDIQWPLRPHSLSEKDQQWLPYQQ